MNELTTTDNRALYAIVDDLATYAETLDLIDAQLATDPDNEDLIRDRSEVVAKQSAIGAELAKKADDVAFALRRLDHEADFLAEERARLATKKAAAERAEKWLRGYVLGVMRQNGLPQIKTARNSFSVRRDNVVDIADPLGIPSDYQTVEVKMPRRLWMNALQCCVSFSTPVFNQLSDLRVKVEPSTAVIKAALKADEPVDGARLIERETLVLR